MFNVLSGNNIGPEKEKGFWKTEAELNAERSARFGGDREHIQTVKNLGR